MCPGDMSAALEEGAVVKAGEPSSALASLEMALRTAKGPVHAKAVGNFHEL